MTELLLPFIIFTLLGLIIGQFIYIYSLTKSHAIQQEKMVTAFLARDATDYAVATKIEKEPIEKPTLNPDLVTTENASDEEFDHHIKAILEDTGEDEVHG